MRIISGSAGSRNIVVPDSVARPSTDRLREALFSILNQRLSDACVLDLFAGSGALGLECLSRGASHCDFIDESRESCDVVRKNLKVLGLGHGRVIQQDVFRFLQSASGGQYNLVFADPPYLKQAGDRDFISELLNHEKLPHALADDGILVVEDPPGNKREDTNGWELIDQRRYGSCGILFYQRL